MASPAYSNPETPATLSCPPFVAVKGIPNFRDLGGYPIGTDRNKSVRRDYIFRCGDPAKATEETVNKIKSLGITHIYDFRSKPEIENTRMYGSTGGVVNWPGVTREYCPVFPEEAYDPASIALRYADYADESSRGMVNAYRTILQQGATAYAVIMRHILAHPPPENAFIMHCTAGKDRTGVIGALILSLCGVSEEIIANEYNLTEAGLGFWTEHLVAAITQSGKVTEDGARRMTGARKENMLNALKMLRDEFGGPEEYFRSVCGLTQEEVDQVKGVLIVDEPSIHN